MHQVVLPCPSCGNAQLAFEVQPPRMLNTQSVSIVVIEHPATVLCPSCSATLALAVAAVPGVGFAAVPVAPKSMIVPAMIVPGR